MATASTGPMPVPDPSTLASGKAFSHSNASFDQTLQEEYGLAVVNGFLTTVSQWLTHSAVVGTVHTQLTQSGVEFYQHVDTSLRVSLKKTHQLPIELAFYDQSNQLRIAVSVSAELFAAFSKARLELEKKLNQRLGKAVQLVLKQAE